MGKARNVLFDILGDFSVLKKFEKWPVAKCWPFSTH